MTDYAKDMTGKQNRLTTLLKILNAGIFSKI